MTDFVSVESFPWTVIESPGEKLHLQSMVAMHVLSKEKGGDPERVWHRHPHWKHMAAFYILDPVQLGVYMVGWFYFLFVVGVVGDSMVAGVVKLLFVKCTV